MTGLLLKPSTTVRLTDTHGVHRWFYVRERSREGYLFEPHDSLGERILHRHHTLMEYYAKDRMVYRPYDDSQLTAARRKRAALTWEALPSYKQVVAERRETILKEVKRAIRHGQRIGVAMKQVPPVVVAANAQAWAEVDRTIAKEKFDRDKLAGKIQEEGAAPIPAKPFAVPSARTVWDWMARYQEMGDNVLALVRYDENKGRGSQLSSEVEEAMRAFIEKMRADKMVGLSPTALHTMLDTYMKALGLKAPSIGPFKVRLNATVSNYEKTLATSGKRAADETRNIAEYVPEPGWALSQVEIDHTLANVHLRCDVTNFVLGRPWITVVLDRLTRVILGCHVSFLPPSWATLSRAIAHAIWMKDLSNLPELTGRWNYHGVFDLAFTDRGMDFISDAARRASMFVGFDIANLPGFSPWLKGKIERCFGTLALQCYNYREGLTAIKDPHYNPRKNAQLTVSEFKTDLIRWIVNYNHHSHSGLRGEISPNDAWDSSIALVGGVPPAPTVSTLRRMMGRSAYVQIGNHGVRNLGLDYFHPRMEELRELYDLAGRKFEIRYDPYNLGAIDFHDGNEWHLAYARRPDVAEGVTAWQHIFHKYIAKAQSKRDVITVDMLAGVKAQAQTDFDLLKQQLGKSKLRTNGSRLARYLDVGQFLTPLSFVAPPPLPLPLEFPDSKLLDDGRYLIPARPDFQIGFTSSQAPLLATPVRPTAAKSVNDQTNSAISKNISPKLSDDLFRTRLLERRKMRGAE